MLYQVAAIAGMAAAARGAPAARQGARRALQHGLRATRTLAAAIARAVAAFDRSLILFGLPDSALLREGERAGLEVAAEIFADRTYDADGSLTSRRMPGSVIHDPRCRGRPRRADGAATAK